MSRIVAERADALPALAEVFREYGYEGTSLARISKATGLGKGSLYHFFPGGKAEMAARVLADIDAWFESNVFRTLDDAARPEDGIAAMFDAVTAYFRSGQRVCLVGVLALGDTRDVFAESIRNYFARWIAALAGALVRGGREAATATALSEETVAGIQGVIVLMRALDDPAIFARGIEHLRARLAAPAGRHSFSAPL